MKTLYILALLSVFLALPVSVAAQAPVLATATTEAMLPDHFTGAGLGFQDTATQKVSGWFATCIKTVPNLYACLSTDYSGGTTSTRGEAHQLLKQVGYCAFFATGGAGAATSVTGGVGGTFDAGGSVGCLIPERILHTKGVAVVFTGSWQKRNVLEAPDIGTALRRFGEQTMWRFGFGRTW